MSEDNFIKIEVGVDDVVFKKELYPRFELNGETVNKYRLAINFLPPIIISKNKILVDGYHRLVAHKLEKADRIKAVVLDIEEEGDILLESIKRNSTHGKQLSFKEKKENARKLYKLNGKHRITQEEIANILSVSQPSVTGWLKDLITTEKEAEDTKILELYLNCQTQEEIAEKLGISQRGVGKRLKSIFRIFIKDSKSSITPSNIQHYNQWQVFSLDNSQLKYPGQTPVDIIDNLIYYYSPEPVLEPKLQLGKVVDPMAGSGVVSEACKRMYRQYLMYDINPVREDVTIERNNILEGLPEKARGADLVFFDPPYFSLMGDDYPENEFTESYESFRGAIDISLKNINKILKVHGNLAIIMKPLNEKMVGGRWFDTTFDIIQLAKKKDFELIKRISVPLSTQQFSASDVARAAELKVMLNTLRDITIFKKVLSCQ